MEILALTDGDRVVETQWLLMTFIGISCEYVHNGSALFKIFDIIAVLKIICVFSATFRDGRSKVSRSIVHTTEPNKNRRAPDKNQTGWYNRIISRSHGDKVSENPIVEGNYQRDINSPNFRSSSQSNNTGAAIKFGF